MKFQNYWLTISTVVIYIVLFYQFFHIEYEFYEVYDNNDEDVNCKKPTIMCVTFCVESSTNYSNDFLLKSFEKSKLAVENFQDDDEQLKEVIRHNPKCKRLEKNEKLIVTENSFEMTFVSK
jgi:hypothetical protein